ncbi:MAG TPA: tetratricopeptide repeat protein [Ignavibacteriaceae bacterium]|nr:tetratricopeptide repeat protein [Ignavibacteriaceae bacterium]
MSSQQDIFSNKLAFLYESNKNSPLFVHAAADEIDKKNIAGAIEILEQGIKNYPFFPPAYIILAKAYALSGNYKLSLDALKSGADLMHSKKTYDFYVREIEGIRKHQDLYSLKDNSGEGQDFSLQNKPETDEVMKDIEDRLEELAREISSSKISPADNLKPEAEKNESFQGGNIIVSETLAKIYISQGEIEEAKKVYLKLIQKHPDREDYYRKKIDELPSGLEG